MSLQHFQDALDFIKSRTQFKPEIGIILGSGLGAFVQEIQKEVVIPFQEIPHFMPPTVEGHQGNLIFGKVGS